jgi:hypothetical protein
VIYLAYLSNRIPILPAFSADSRHIGFESRDVAVSEIFDLSRLKAVLGDKPLVEMHELKLTERTPARLRVIIYDEEMAMFDEEGEVLELGSWIEPQVPERDTLGCFSWQENMQKSPPGNGFPGNIRKPVTFYRS